jgi:hypothetical protein
LQSACVLSSLDDTRVSWPVLWPTNWPGLRAMAARHAVLEAGGFRLDDD